MSLGLVRAALAALSACMVLSACATPRAVSPPETAPRPAAPAPAARPPAPEPLASIVPLSALPGWADEDHLAALSAWRRTCHAAREPALAAVCRRARDLEPAGRAEARAFLDAHFAAVPVEGSGVLTAYFAPVYDARSRPDAEFSAAVRPRPADLVAGAAQPYLDRTAIEATPEARPLAWMRPEELFFLQIQGSGVLVFEDGKRMKALYAAHNGHPFVGVANAMRERGLLGRDQTSGEAIRAWLAANRGPAAEEIMRLNPRYAFFRLAPDDGLPPAGAAGVPLPAGRAIAVDPGFHAYGQPFWIDGQAPLLAGAFPTYRRMVTALDTGGAIRGRVRADLYLGEGAAAGLEAGRVRHDLRMYRLVPRPAVP